MLTNRKTVFTLSVRDVREERVVTNFEQDEGEALARLTQTWKQRYLDLGTLSRYGHYLHELCLFQGILSLELLEVD